MPVNVPAVATILCGSQAAWLVGVEMLLQATFAEAGIQILAIANVHSLESDVLRIPVTSPWVTFTPAEATQEQCSRSYNREIKELVYTDVGFDLKAMTSIKYIKRKIKSKKKIIFTIITI